MQKKSPEYRTWTDIKTRCYNPKYSGFADYGGRGIRVCDRWLHSFDNFLTDMGPKPSPSHSIDRYPNKDGDYGPGNCRWATPAEQTRNKRSNINITFQGETLCLNDWAKKLNIPRQSLKNRIFRFGWSIERAFQKNDNRQELMITYNGQTKCLSHWAKELGIRRETLTYRIKNGWSNAAALSTSVR